MKSFDWKEFLWSPENRILSKRLSPDDLRDLGHSFEIRGMTRTIKFVYKVYVPIDQNDIKGVNADPPRSGYWKYTPDEESTPYEYFDIVATITSQKKF